MMTDKRREELASLFWAETNEDWTQEWRDDLTPEEAALVEQWDRDFEMGLARMCNSIGENRDT